MKSLLTRARIAAMTVGLFIGLPVISANAQNNYTDAGEVVSNTFTLDYQVGSVSQTTITNDGAGGNPPPTTFTVDRKVDVFVESLGDVSVVPGATGQDLVFRVRNDGNDTQAYSFALEDLAGDDFDTTVTMRYYVDAGGDDTYVDGVDNVGGVAYTAGSGTASSDLAPDATLWVVISGDIAGTVTNGQADGHILYADSLDPTAWINSASATPGAETLGEAGANNEDGAAQNVLADGQGTAAADAATPDGGHSDTASFTVSAANLSASKTVAIIATDSTAIDCSVDPAVAGNQFYIPGACLEYLISVSNGAGAATATDIDIADVLPDEVAYVGATQSGFSTAGTITPPGGGCSTACSVALDNAELAAGATGELRIRATVR